MGGSTAARMTGDLAARKTGREEEVEQELVAAELHRRGRTGGKAGRRCLERDASVSGGKHI